MSYLSFVELALGLLAAGAFPVVRKILESNAVMFGGIIDIATDAADVFA